MSKEKENVELDTGFDFHEYAIMNMNIDNLKDIIRENLGDEDVSQFDLRKAKVEGKTWIIPGIDKDIETKELVGIVIMKKTVRSFWEKGIDEGADTIPPDCASEDGEVGVGNPGGICYKCPLSQWGSDPKGGKGQACSKRTILYILQEEDILPLVVLVPPSSLKNFKSYFLGLTSKNIPFFGVKTKFTIEEAKNGNGIKYGMIIPTMVEVLEPQFTNQLRIYSETVKTFLKRTDVYSE